MNPVRFGAITKLVAKNAPPYPVTWLNMSQFTTEQRTRFEQNGTSVWDQSQAEAEQEFVRYEAAQQNFVQAIDEHIAGIQAQHAQNPNHPIAALKGHFQTLVLDGEDLKQYLLDIQLRKQQYTRMNVEDTAKKSFNTPDYDERAASKPVPAFNWVKAFLPVSNPHWNQWQEQTAEADVYREYFQHKATQVDVTV